MKTIILSAVLAIATGSLPAAESSLKADVAAAAKKLSQQGSYSWKTTTETANFTATTEGKADKEGLVSLSFAFGDNTSEAFLKGEKGVLKRPEQDWQTIDEALANSEPGPGQFLLRRLKNYKLPIAEAEEIAGKVKEFKKDGAACSGDLTEAGAKEMLAFGGRRGGNALEAKNAKGSVKFWTKDGQLTKYEFKLQGTMNFNGEDRDIDRTTTVEFKDVGTTKIVVPDAAKKKLS